MLVPTYISSTQANSTVSESSIVQGEVTQSLASHPAISAKLAQNLHIVGAAVPPLSATNTIRHIHLLVERWRDREADWEAYQIQIDESQAQIKYHNEIMKTRRKKGCILEAEGA
jgi:hypothetical protein